MIQEDSEESKVKIQLAISRWKEKASSNTLRQQRSIRRINSQALQTIQENMATLSNFTSASQPNKIIINVGGVRFETYRTTLRNIPDTRLAWITESKSDNPDYDPISGEYFFDRHPNMFLMILNYYRTGKLHVPSDICGPAFEDELAFWGIDEKQIQPCCWGTYSKHRDAQQTLEVLKLDTNSVNYEEEAGIISSTAEKFGILEDIEVKQSCWDKLKPFLWSVLDDQSPTKAAKVFMIFSSMLTLLLIVTFVLETHECCREFNNETSYQSPLNYTVQEYIRLTKPMQFITILEVICMVELTVECIAKIIFNPHKLRHFQSFLTWIDLLSLLSFYISTTLKFIDIVPFDYSFVLLLQFLRMTRVFRITHIAKHFRGLKILVHTLKASATELFLMLMLIMSLGIIFASFIYFAEQVQEVPDNHFRSIGHGFWWSIVTMTTLGYGDKVPKTLFGYIIGILCAIFGVMFIALPIPIIVNNFSIYYSHAQAQEKLPKKKRNALVGAADALKQVAELPINLSCDVISETSSLASESGESNNLKLEQQDRNNNAETAILAKQKFANDTNHTHTEMEDPEEIILPGSTIQSRTNNSKLNGYHLTRQGSSYDEKLAESVEPEKPNKLLTRRASLLPGGITNVTAESNQQASSSQVPNPRERRRSLLPSVSLYNIGY